MASHVLRRVVAAVPVLVLLSLLVWLSSLIIPGDPATTLAGDTATPAQIETIRKTLELDEPLPSRFASWASDAVRGDLGDSFVTRRPVVPTIVERIPVTLSLATMTMIVSLLIALPLGTLAAARAGRWPDRIANAISSLSIAVPSYWLGGMLVLLFAVNLKVLPSIGYVGFAENPWEWFRHMILPAVAASCVTVGLLTRQVREAVRSQLGRTYVRTARAYGASDLQVLRGEVAKNAAVPVVTTFGIQVVHALGGAIIIEKIFGLPGIGTLAIDSVVLHDLPMIQGVVLFVGVITIMVNLVVDISYLWFAPWTRA